MDLISVVFFISSMHAWMMTCAVLVIVALLVVLISRRQEKALGEPDPHAQKRVLHTAMQLDAVRNILADTGYAYDWQNNIFYSVRNPWQRKFGYCSLYDETAAPLGMVIDCEPVCFDYDGKKWLIELWKGQYGIACGAEIGIYSTTGPDLNIPGLFNGTFYFSADDEDNLSMTCTLARQNTALFTRASKHWWLTGFSLGTFSKPSRLRMEASITFKDMAMHDAFFEALKKMGYTGKDLKSTERTVLVLFDKPYSKQPHTRRGLIGRLALRRNKRLVQRYRKTTKGLVNMYDILMELKEKSPQLYDMVTHMGRSKELFEQYETIKRHMGV